MKQSRTKIAGTIAATTLKSGLSRRYSKQIAAYLLSERRTAELNSLLRDVQAAWAEAGHVEVIASSAHTLNAAVKTDISKQVKRLYPQASKITITETLRPDIIGGVQLRLPNQQLDLSVQAKLRHLKQLTTTGKD